ncbi:MAG: ABC transporter ATP-binding protein [Ezakiella sp.]|nr:ABC transporter ATP-binding protein [Ezakiella sp.]MDD7471679.1 ABC transporter ATP-binding protein [Bacillota bacterium]MDY3922865.1 ABC transporter ATP-binding protein [Ezakiella sp.]
MIVEVKKLIKRYGDKIVLNGFNMNVEKGKITGLIGPNGSGKTTAINCILGLLTHDSGEINVFGGEMKPNSYDKKARIGIVPQDIVVIPELKVQENIEFFCSLYEKDSKKVRMLAEEAMEFVNIGEYRNYLPKKLSGGLKRRLNIACGIAHKPELLVLDEPTVAVDAQSRNFILNKIKDLSKNGTSVIYTTHYMEEVEMIADNIVIIKDGKNIATGTLDSLLNMIEDTEKISISLLTKEDMSESFKTIPNVKKVTFEDGVHNLSFKDADNNLRGLINFLDEHNLKYSHIYSEKPRLNQIYLELTGKELVE